MIKRKVHAIIFATLLVPFLRAVPAQAFGDKVVPQMVDGLYSDGTTTTRLRTIFDFTNLSYNPTPQLSKVTLMFFQADGSPWNIAIKNPDPSVTTPLTTNSVLLNLDSAQAIRIETLGTGLQMQGYAILRNLEAATYQPDDKQVSITVYYEIAKANALGGFDINETVSVPVGQPTVSWSFPVEIDKTKNQPVLTSFTIVNLSDMPDISSKSYVNNTTNTVTFDLFGTDGTKQQTATFYLNNLPGMPGMARKGAFYINQQTVDFGFPNPLPDTFRGTVFASSTGPVAFLSVQETTTTSTTSTGVQFGQQYAMLVPTYLDSLRTNTFMLLPQGFSLDGDIPVVDYFSLELTPLDPGYDSFVDVYLYYKIPWDLLYLTGDTSKERWLVPFGGGMISSIALFDANNPWPQFNALTVEDLSNRTYTTDRLALGDSSANFAPGFCFAIKTGLGRYAKVLIWYINEYPDNSASPKVYYADLMLAIQVFK